MTTTFRNSVDVIIHQQVVVERKVLWWEWRKQFIHEYNFYVHHHHQKICWRHQHLQQRQFLINLFLAASTRSIVQDWFCITSFLHVKHQAFICLHFLREKKHSFTSFWWFLGFDGETYVFTFLKSITRANVWCSM